MKNKQQPTFKQQRQILVISVLGILFTIWATATYFSEHPSIITVIKQPVIQMNLTDIQKKQPVIAEDDNTNTLMILMQNLETNPQDIQTLFEISKYFMDISDWNQSEIFALKIIEITPDNPDVFYILGIAQHNQGKYKEAEKSLQCVLERGNDPDAQYSLGLLYIYYLDETKKGISYLNLLLENPNTPSSLKIAAEKELSKHKD